MPPGLNSLNAVTFDNASVGWGVGGNTTGVNVPGCLSAGTSPPGILATTDG